MGLARGEECQAEDAGISIEVQANQRDLVMDKVEAEAKGKIDKRR